MNRSLYEYCLGSPGGWFRLVSADARWVQSLVNKALNAPEPNDAELLGQLRTVASLDDEVFRILRPLHGCGGSEGYVLDVEPAEEAEFWDSLATHFPAHQGICYIAADSAHMAGDMDSARRLFMQAFRLDPAHGSPFPVDWEALLQGTAVEFEYRLHLLAETRRNDPVEGEQQAASLLSEFAEDRNKQRMITAVARGEKVPSFPADGRRSST